MPESVLTPGGIATLACCLEVAASKPGNVHRGADFEDVGLNDFLASAVAMGQTIDANADQAMGPTVLAAVHLTQHLAGSNTNLGMILLIVPLAKALAAGDLSSAGLTELLGATSDADAESVFAAIRLAKPGGLGSTDQMDVTNDAVAPEGTLLEAMELAAGRDLVARQYTNGFEQIFAEVVPTLLAHAAEFSRLSEAVVATHLAMMARHPDSLIARKCGPGIAAEAQTRAADVVERLPRTEDDLEHEQFWSAVADFDFWLRSDGHRRNPGTTADLIAAGLFVALANGDISAPFG